MIARLVGTVLGSAMALAAYGLWPTWERERTRTILARLLHAYAAYLASFGAATAPQERRETRHLVRVARGNAEASVNRLLAEPATPAPLAELAQSLLTNTNRLARTAMTLEALLGQGRPAPPVEELIGECAGAMRQVAEALRTEQCPAGLAPIRASQRRLAQRLGADDRAGLAEELVTLTDRLVDNINMLAHLVGRAARPAPVAQAA